MVATHYFQDVFNVVSEPVSVTLPRLKENPLKISFENGDMEKMSCEVTEPPLPFANSEVFHASLVGSRRMTSDHEGCKNVYEVTLDVTGSKFSYNPGDTIGIIPQNEIADVDFLLSHLDVANQADLPYKLSVDEHQKAAKIPAHVPVRSTLRHILTNCLDLRCVLKKLFILSLSKHTKDKNERKALEYLSSKEGAVKYNTHILNKKTCLVDLLVNFTTCRPPIEVLLNHLPRLLPRPYSIVNSQKKAPNVIKICFSVMELNNKRRGLVTGWLEEMISNNCDLEESLKNLRISDRQKTPKIPIYLRKNVSGFSMPNSIETRLLLIGPGTGVAPYIGFLEDRELLKQNNPDINMGKSWLLFGCRNRQLDFLYEQELNAFMKSGTLNKLTTAFSREDNCECKYIQDIMNENGKELIEFIKNGASIFVCGDLQTMANQIRHTLVQCFVTHDRKTIEEAEIMFDDLQKEKRYFVDAWS